MLSESYWKNKQQGFTIIELIVALVLIGILSVTVVSRFLSPSSFASLSAQEQIIAMARSAQQLALGRASVSFTLNQSGDNWLVAARESGAIVNSLEFSTNNLILETGSTAASADTCASGFDTAVSNDFEVSFDGMGNADQFTNNGSSETVSNGVRICINDNNDLAICISPGGFAYKGACDD